METPEKVSKNTKANITSTPNWDGLQDDFWSNFGMIFKMSFGLIFG